MFTSNSPLSPLGTRVSRVIIQNVSRSHHFGETFGFRKTPGIASITHTHMPVMVLKKMVWYVCLSQPTSMKQQCLPKRCFRGRIVQKTYRNLQGHVRQYTTIIKMYFSFMSKILSMFKAEHMERT